MEIQAGGHAGGETRRLARPASPAFRARRHRWRTARSSPREACHASDKAVSNRVRFMDIAPPGNLGCILRQLLGESGREPAAERRKSFRARQDSVLRCPPRDRMRVQEPARARGDARAAGSKPSDPNPGLIVMPEIGNTVSPVGAPARRASEPPKLRSGVRAGSVFGRTVSRNPTPPERLSASVRELRAERPGRHAELDSVLHGRAGPNDAHVYEELAGSVDATRRAPLGDARPSVPVTRESATASAWRSSPYSALRPPPLPQRPAAGLRNRRVLPGPVPPGQLGISVRAGAPRGALEGAKAGVPGVGGVAASACAGRSAAAHRRPWRSLTERRVWSFGSPHRVRYGCRRDWRCHRRVCCASASRTFSRPRRRLPPHRPTLDE